MSSQGLWTENCEIGDITKENPLKSLLTTDRG